MINKLIVVAATAFCPAIIIILSNICCINTSQKFYRQFFFRSAVSQYRTRQNQSYRIRICNIQRKNLQSVAKNEL